MCEECERRQERVARDIEDPLMVAVSERFEALAGALINDESTEAADVEPLRARQGSALQFGLGLEELEAAIAKLAYVQVNGMARGVDPFSCLEAAALQGMTVGWLLRDEQLKAARAEDAPAT